MVRKNCWEFKKCGRQQGGANIKKSGECPAAKCFKAHGINNGINGGRACWAIAGTYCGGKIQGVFCDKILECSSCEFFQLVQKEEKEDFNLANNEKFSNDDNIFKKLKKIIK
jgi:hypothetical protein